VLPISFFAVKMKMQSGRWSVALLCVAATLCATWSLLDGARPGSSYATAEEEDMEKGGTCGLGTFIPAMPCAKNTESKPCCHGLKGVFKSKCACA
jgi:hypothetical protein